MKKEFTPDYETPFLEGDKLNELPPFIGDGFEGEYKLESLYEYECPNCLTNFSITIFNIHTHFKEFPEVKYCPFCAHKI